MKKKTKLEKSKQNWKVKRNRSVKIKKLEIKREKVKNKIGNLNRKAKWRSENQNFENENGKVKTKKGNLSQKAK